MCSLSYVHVYRIEYVSYRQGPYRIRIVSAADRIVPALGHMTSQKTRKAVIQHIDMFIYIMFNKIYIMYNKIYIMYNKLVFI